MVQHIKVLYTNLFISPPNRSIKMSIVGFTFHKIVAEKNTKAKAFTKLDVNNNVAITDIEQVDDFPLGKSKQEALKFLFEYTTRYVPDIGEMFMTGEIIYLGDPKRNEEILKRWKKDKKLVTEVSNDIINNILMRCNIESLILSRDINLPPPIPLPRVRESGEEKKGGDSEYIG